jgi:quercetin dioxygenase-like cupin family protein
MKTLLVLLLLSLAGLVLLAAQRSSDPAPVPVEQEPHHHVVLKNDSIIVLRVTLPEGERTLYHIHSRDRVSIELSNATISQQNLNEPEGESGPTKPGEISAPTARANPLIHRIHNFGPGTFEVLDVEFFQRPAQPSTEITAPVVAENPSARVYSWALAPGASSAMHTHTRPYLLVAITKMPLKMTAPDGQFASHEVQAGDFHWVDAKVRHSLTNEGATPGQIIEIELK